MGIRNGEHGAFPSKKVLEKYLSDKYHVQFGHFVNFSDKNVLPPPPEVVTAIKSWTSCGAKVKHNKPRPCVAHRSIACFLRIDPNWITSSYGHSAPSLKISCKLVEPFSHNLADKETKKERNKQRYIHTKKQRNWSKTIPRLPIYWGRGN